MAEIGFYHLTRSTLEEALPRLLDKAYAAGQRALVRVGSPERVELLDRALWTFARESFLPHGTWREADELRPRSIARWQANVDNFGTISREFAALTSWHSS